MVSYLRLLLVFTTKTNMMPDIEMLMNCYLIALHVQHSTVFLYSGKEYLMRMQKSLLHLKLQILSTWWQDKPKQKRPIIPIQKVIGPKDLEMRLVMLNQSLLDITHINLPLHRIQHGGQPIKYRLSIVVLWHKLLPASYYWKRWFFQIKISISDWQVWQLNEQSGSSLQWCR